VRLGQLATHTSGLPRLAPNHQEVQQDPADPYADYDVDALTEALGRVRPQPTDVPEYSNFGYQLLGHVLAVTAGGAYDALVVDRVLTPAGCRRPRCGAPRAEDDLIPGYQGIRSVPRWRQPLAGAGGVYLGIGDLARWVAANVEPDSTPLGDALRLAQQPHWGDQANGRGLGWILVNRAVLHNGGTGGFRSVCGFVPGRAGVALMVNLADWEVIDGVAIRRLTAMGA
jgi:CubicO group peptidase (beta-lactamase class C family)